MPTRTYMNLPASKRKRILLALRKEFCERNLDKATVKNIVTNLKIARGSFYQYFGSLQEAYFYLIEETLINIHQVFIEILRQNNFDIIASLVMFEPLLIKDIYHSGNYSLYKQLYLTLNPNLNLEWTKYKKDRLLRKTSVLKENEKMNFVRIVIHYLIQKIFIENLDEGTFKKYYSLYLNWLKEGITCLH